jgi:hypothetical protein
MFWRNGYEPLAALDDNRDGVLSGGEVTGIAVWRDANSNGVSDPGEVVPAEMFGIVEIEVRPRLAGVTLQSGIRLRDGVRLTTFDWMPTSMVEMDTVVRGNAGLKSRAGLIPRSDARTGIASGTRLLRSR